MIVSMNKVALLGLEEQRKALIGSLMEFGAVDISAADGKEYEELAHNPVIQDELSGMDGKINEIHAAIDILNKYCPEKKMMFQGRREITLSEFNRAMESKAAIWEAVRNIREHEEHLNQLKSEENKLNNLYASLLSWKNSPIPLEAFGTQKTMVVLGTIPSTVGFEQLEKELYDILEHSVIEQINSDRDQYYLYIICHRDYEQECLSFLKSRGFNRTVFTGLSGLVSENLDLIGTGLKELIAAKEDVIQHIRNLKDARKSVEILYDALVMERDRLAAAGKILKTRKVFFLQGWIPEKLAIEAKKKLETLYTVHIDISKPGEDEEFPVLLENNGFAEASEPVTNMYSLPSSREIDPNAVMTPFFIMFFGLMLSDGGYGIIMVLLAGFVLWRFKLEDGTRRFMKLILYCGLSTIFWGIMFGGWFGIDALVKYGVWLNPVNEPELLLSWALLFGVIHMYAGIGIRAANLIKRKKYLDALFDAGFCYIYYTGFILILLPYVPRIDSAKAAPLVNLGQYLFIGGAVLMLLTQGRSSKKIIGKFIGGLGSLYNVVGFMSDVLSYSRLLALGLATGIIATIINQMSNMFNFNIILKIAIAVIILLVGHTINFAINSLGAYVHSCRLQFLEFFGKFYTGGGQPFRPLKANTKYITVKPDA